MSSPTQPGTAESRDYGVLRWLVAAAFVVILNETVMFNALPSLMREFAVDVTTAQWLSTAFMLTMAVVIPVTGWFLQRVTTRQAFGLAMAVFCTGTPIAALAPAFWVLLLGRIVQACGTAVMMPLLMTTMMTVVAPAGPRPGDGQHDPGDVRGAGARPDRVRPDPRVRRLALDVRRGAAHRRCRRPGRATVSCATSASPAPASIDLPSVVLSAIGFGALVYGLSELGRGGGARIEARASSPPSVWRSWRRSSSSSCASSGATGRCSTCGPSAGARSPGPAHDGRRLPGMFGAMLSCRSTCRTCATSAPSRPVC